MEAALLQLLAESGVDVTEPRVQATARRHVLALLAATSGYHQEQPSRPVLRPPQQQQQQQQQQQPEQAAELQQYQHTIPFISQCEHHMLPFHGTVHISYLLPRGSSSPGSPSSGSGASACQHSASCPPRHRNQPQPPQQPQPQQPLSDAEARQLVRCFTRRLQVQERITQQLADGVQRLLAPAGVMVVVRAAHMCMVARGVENHAGSTSSRAALGLYEAQPALRCAVLRQLAQQEQQEQQRQQQKC
jgi:GTP cyclohydrolase I